MAALGPYLAMAVMVVVGFFLQGANTARVEREAKQRDHAICMDGNERAGALRAFIDRLGDEFPISADAAERLATIASEEFAPKSCPPAP